MPRREALHDARSVGDAEREDVRLPVVGDARRSRGAPERQTGGRDKGLPAARGEGGGMRLPIYLDYSATTPVDPRVAQKMIPFLTEDFGNPASRSHSFGWTAEKAVEAVRELERQGFEATYLGVKQNGLLDLDQLTAVLRKDTVLVSVMAVNNEIG